MLELIAKNPKQLDLGCRLLYAEHVQFSFDVKETVNGKIYYKIYYVLNATVGKQTEEVFSEKYRVMTR